MSWEFHSVILVLLISCCGADYEKLFSADIADTFKGYGFKQDPITFACIYNSRFGVYILKISLENIICNQNNKPEKNI